MPYIYNKMALFEVDGWDIKSDKIAMGGVGQKKEKRDKKKRERKRKAQEAEEQQEKEFEEEVEQEHKKQKLQEKSKQESEAKKVVKVEKPAAAPVAQPEVSRKLTPLQQKMMAKLSGSRFRWINEQLYTTTSEKALQLVKEQPALFDEYHHGFRSQVQLWPENPVDVFVEQIKARTAKPVNAPGGLPGLSNKKVVVADMGCGEAQLSLDVSTFLKAYNTKKKQPKGDKRSMSPRNLDIKVHSFDLQKANDRITVADIKNVPLPDESCTIVIFCLALMGTNFLDFIEEAYRLLAPNGELWIAEIKSRFNESTNAKSKSKPEEVGTEFMESLKLLGFYHKKTDNDNKMFTRFEFFKPSREIMQQRREKLEKRKKFIEHESQKEELEQKRAKQAEGAWLLKPCIYKRR